MSDNALIFVLGPSGSGKSTFIDTFAQNYAVSRVWSRGIKCITYPANLYEHDGIKTYTSMSWDKKLEVYRIVADDLKFLQKKYTIFCQIHPIILDDIFRYWKTNAWVRFDIMRFVILRSIKDGHRYFSKHDISMEKYNEQFKEWLNGILSYLYDWNFRCTLNSLKTFEGEYLLGRPVDGFEQDYLLLPYKSGDHTDVNSLTKNQILDKLTIIE